MKKFVSGVLKRLPLSVLLPCSSYSLLIYVIAHQLLLPTAILAIGLCLLLRQELGKTLHPRSPVLAFKSPLLIQSLLCLGATGMVVLDTLALPAQAQFMHKAETFFEKFTQSSGVGSNVIDLIFGTLRGLFLLYLGVALIRVVQAAR